MVFYYSSFSKLLLIYRNCIFFCCITNIFTSYMTRAAARVDDLVGLMVEPLSHWLNRITESDQIE